MTKAISNVQPPQSKSPVKKHFNRNFLNTLNARRAKMLKQKEQRWCFNFETETKIDLELFARDVDILAD